MSKPIVKILILNWNGVQLLREYLPVVRATTPSDVEIVVIDNGSTDNSVEILQKEFPNITLIKFSDNYGYAGGYNKAVEMLEGDYFVLLNSDVKTTTGWLDPLVSALENDKNIAVVAPKLLDAKDPKKFEYAGACGGFIDALGYPFCRGRILNHLETDKRQYDNAREVFWASGACFVVRRDVFVAQGGFDENFFAHMEEIDLCWRIKNAGYKVMIEPKSKVFHLGGASLDNTSPFKLKLNFRNNLLMLYKNLPNSRLHPTLFIRMCLDGLVAMLYLLQGKVSYFKAVIIAHREFYKAKKTRLPQKNRPSGVYCGSIILRSIFTKSFPNI